MLNSYFKFLKKTCILLFFLCSIHTYFSQTIFTETSIDSIYKNYASSYVEVVYIHLNKVKFIKGEMLGFTAYTFDKHRKTLSRSTRNLYCIITDANNQIVQKKMINVENGIANGEFMIDSKFKDGTYTFSAYTNWMLNFPINTIFSENFKVIDGAENSIVNKIKKSNSIDIQLLPESGHLLNDVINTVCVIVKDTLNYGVPNLKGEIFTEDNVLVNSFKLNHLGIGRFSIKPKKGEKYKAVFYHNNLDIEQSVLNEIKTKGVILRITYNNTHCIVSLVTNSSTLPNIKKKNFLLTYHNNSKLHKIYITFNDTNVITKKIPLSSLDVGINNFSLFDFNNKQIAERLFFNYKNLKVMHSTITSIEQKDSLVKLKLTYDKVIQNKFNNVSISVLPKKTKSDSKNSNILSQVLLRPYINGVIENGGYYFKKINAKTKYDLDNLLITQAWSSFSWDSIFKSLKKTKDHVFENGISININIPKKEKVQKLLIYGTKYNETRFLDIYKNTKNFNVSNFIAFNDETLNISKVDFRGKLSKTNVEVSFYPKEIPKLNKTHLKKLPVIETYAYENYAGVDNFSMLNKDQILNEIIITANLEKVRRKKVKSKSLGRVFFVDKVDQKQSLANFLNSKPGIFAFDDYSSSQLVVQNKITHENLRLVFNGIQVSEYLLFNYWIDVVDYIEVDTTPPLFSTKNHAGGTVTIKTVSNAFSKTDITLNTFKFPLTFSKARKFYIPKYENYESAFFNNYGVIDWLPKNKIDANGVLEIAFKKTPTKNVALFIEGVTEDGTFIFEELIIGVE